MKSILLFALAGVMLCVQAHASDIVRGVKTGAGVDLSNGGYLELGGGVYVGTKFVEEVQDEDDEEPLYYGGLPIVAGAYRYNNFFFEAVETSFDGLNLGYTLWANDTWVVDALFASINGGFNSDQEDISSSDDERTRNSKLVERNTLFIGAGTRVTGYLGDTILQYRLVNDVLGNGYRTTMRVGHHWQYRNWNFYGVGGVAYVSKDNAQHMWGVEEEYATSRFAAYQSKSSLNYESELGLAYPVSENVVFRTFIRHLRLSDDAEKSPIIRKKDVYIYAASFSYVF